MSTVVTKLAMQALRHGRHFGPVPQQITPCAPQARNVPLLAKIMPPKKPQAKDHGQAFQGCASSHQITAFVPQNK